jgi:hypothetical protein
LNIDSVEVLPGEFGADLREVLLEALVLLELALGVAV